MLGLREDNEDQMSQTIRMKIGKLRGKNLTKADGINYQVAYGNGYFS